MKHFLQRFRNDENGTSVVELGLVAPILAAFVIGMIDYSKAYSEKLRIEQVAQRSVERAMQGMQGNNSTAIFNALAQEAADEAGVNVNAVAVRYWLECNGVSQFTTVARMDADYNDPCPNGDHQARYISIRIVSSFRPTLRTNWPGTVNGAFVVSGDAGLRVQ
jgi:Flp pilus assembly protein TadG